MLASTEMLYELYKEANSIPVSDSVKANAQFDIVDQLNTRSTLIVKNISERIEKEQLDLKDATFEVSIPPSPIFPKELNMDMAYTIHGRLKSETTRHLIFNIIEYRQKIYLLTPFFLLMSDEMYYKTIIGATASVSSDQQGMLTISGSIATTNKTATAEEISSCLQDNLFIDRQEKPEVQLVKGRSNLRFPIFSVVSGGLNYQYEYTFSHGFIHYSFSDFRNPEPESDFKALDQIPLEPNEAILAVLDQEKYKRFITTIERTLVNTLAERQILIEGCLKE
ncbi:MAG: hypothetical protein HEP71_06640 [Roseivirga sp.]|nr:hypothetical protein [Roseivirga sp.]